MGEPAYQLPEEDRADIRPHLRALEGSGEGDGQRKGNLSSVKDEQPATASSGAQASDTLGKGFTGAATAAKTLPGAAFITPFISTRRRKAASGGVVGIIATLVIFFATISSGPLQLIHYSQLLQGAFKHQNSSSDARMGKLMRWARTRDVGQTRISFIESHFMLPRIKADFAKQGIKFNVDKFGRINVVEIDPKLNPRYSGLSNTEAKNLLAADNGIDISKIQGNSENSFKFNIRDMNITEQRAFIRSYVENVGNGKISSAIRFRVLTRYLNVPSWLHPFKRLTAEADKRWSNRATRPSALKEYLKSQKDKISARSPAAKAQVADVESKLGVKGNLAAGGLVLTAALCVTKDIAHSIPEINRANVVIPAMQSAGNALAIGGQLALGEDVSQAEVGAVASSLTGPDGSTVWDSKAIRALNGETGGKDVGNDIKGAFSPDSNAANIEAGIDAVPGASALCSGVGQIAQGVVGVALLFTGPGGVIAKGASAAVSTIAFGAAISGIKALVDAFATDTPLTGTPHQGAKGGTVDALGAHELAATAGRTQGGAAVDSAQQKKIQTIGYEEDQQSFHSQSLYAQLFDVKDVRSVSSRLIDKINPNVAQNIASLLTLPLHMFNFSNLASLFNPHTYAADAVGYQYPSPEYVVDQRILDPTDSAMVDDPYANADAVADLLGSSDGGKYIDKAKSCTGNTLGKDSQGLWTITDNKDINPSSADYISQNCADTSDKNWVRVRFFIQDTSLMVGYACQHGDDQACRDSGFGDQSSGAQNTGDVTAVSGDAQALAQSILKNSNIQLTGRLVAEDVQAAATGQPGSAGVMTSSAILRLIATVGQTHKLTISAIQSGGTGHCSNTPKASCPDDAHYTGDGVDFNYVDGIHLSGRDPGSLIIITAGEALLPSGTGFGQSNCGAAITLPSGFTQFTDTCNHLHVQVPKGTP